MKLNWINYPNPTEGEAAAQTVPPHKNAESQFSICPSFNEDGGVDFYELLYPMDGASASGFAFLGEYPSIECAKNEAQVIADRELRERLQKIVDRKNATQPVKTSVERILSKLEDDVAIVERIQRESADRRKQEELAREAELEAQKRFAIGDRISFVYSGAKTGSIESFAVNALLGPVLYVKVDGFLNLDNTPHFIRVLKNNVEMIP